MSGGGKDRRQKADLRGGQYVLLPHAVLKSEAYRTLPHPARSVLGLLLFRFNGFNNGRIPLSLREIADAFGTTNHAAASDALEMLRARGLVVLAKDYPSGSRLAREYRITFISSGDGGRVPATNEYVVWTQASDDHRKIAKSRGSKISAEAAGSAANHVEEAKRSAEFSIAVECKTPGKGGNRVLPSASKNSAPISCHSPPQRNPLPRLPNLDPATTAAPSAVELRDRLTTFLSTTPYGAQGRLAKTAGLSNAELSRFRHGNTELTPAKRILLACAFPRATAAEQRGEDAPAPVAIAEPPAPAEPAPLASAQELRAAVRDYKKRHKPGCLGRLATAAKIAPAMLSGFLSSGARLPAAAVDRLAAALPLADAAESARPYVPPPHQTRQVQPPSTGANQ
jgi:hypothetical protein